MEEYKYLDLGVKYRFKFFVKNIFIVFKIYLCLMLILDLF
jgi:hypothetical protein